MSEDVSHEGSLGAALLVTAARAGLSAAFAVSALAKLRDLRAFADSLERFGSSGHFGVRGALVPLVPVLEGACGVSLLLLWSSPWPAWLALALLGAFTAAVLGNLVRGRRPPCPCFDPRAERPISGATLVRNAGLLALAVLATGSPGGVPPVSSAVVAVAAGVATVVAVRRYG